ncbi:hypothetical protein CP532_3767 [Ophiocordyceps camponoti-leonardi (nom. inval.)]|nr:hypothetical protein CP532_3767 [Ophiocordyceps camponoti-leonardi (nom. inval.)]
MNQTPEPPDSMRPAYSPLTNTVSQSNNVATSVYLSNPQHHQKQPSRLPQLTSRDAQRQIDQETTHRQNQSQSPAQASPLSSIKSQQYIQHHSLIATSQMQPLSTLSDSSSSRQVEPPSLSYLSSIVHRSVSDDNWIVHAQLANDCSRLDVVQQPRRARMCGFGDKVNTLLAPPLISHVFATTRRHPGDRRPITPPPCVRLIITDALTGTEIDCNSIDHSMFVLNVDLWNQDGTREVNLVRSSTGSPSISSTTPYSYTTLNGCDVPMVPYSQPTLPPSRDATYDSSQMLGLAPEYQLQAGYVQAPSSYHSNGNFVPTQQFFPQHQGYREDGIVSSASSQANIAQFTRNGVPVTPGFVQDHNSLSRMSMVGGQPQGMFTRNLIGSLAASAFRLSDTLDHIGIWFVLQDLSVRTEGSFRLRFSFVNVGARGGARRDSITPRINTGRAPILASCFSDVFNVYSAKKFPGVCESTPLSKTFATQGIKIPIRKDANVKGGDDDDYGE